MKYVIWILVVALLVLHQDDWLDWFPFFGFWKSPELVFGFMPKTLLYHAGISLAAGITWYLATLFAWPEELQQTQANSPAKDQQA